MTSQSVRQAARRAALEAQSTRRRERVERDRRLEAMAVRVLVAVGERDAAVADADRRAGAALRRMTDQEGLSVREAVQWCGARISTREAARLRRLAETTHVEAAPPANQKNAPPGNAGESASRTLDQDATGAAAS